MKCRHEYSHCGTSPSKTHYHHAHVRKTGCGDHCSQRQLSETMEFTISIIAMPQSQSLLTNTGPGWINVILAIGMAMCSIKNTTRIANGVLKLNYTLGRDVNIRHVALLRYFPNQKSSIQQPQLSSKTLFTCCCYCPSTNVSLALTAE